MKVKIYRDETYRDTITYDVKRVLAMPEPEYLTPGVVKTAKGVELALVLKDGEIVLCPHHLLISIAE